MSVHLAKGTRDHLPEKMNQRLHVIGILREVFERYGFEPLETPAFERIETLLGKYGDEGEQLIFKILKRGEGGKRGEVDQALRYDLTVPLARVVAMNPALRMPFKRYQIQPVWRADRPQRGRYREFVQCDVDTLGCTSMLADAECVAVLHDSLVALGFTGFTIRVNHRAILSACVAAAGLADMENSVLVAVDKLDKIGEDGVSKELRDRGVSEEAIATLWRLFSVRGPGALDHLEALLGDSAAEAIGELRTLLDIAAELGVALDRVLVDPTLARGLGYYTGPVFEAEVTEPKIGSISGGGRYDGLVGIFSKRQVPAVGLSLGLDRLVVVMEELGLFPDLRSAVKVLVTVYSEELLSHSVRASSALRQAGIPTQMVLDRVGKIGKQFKQADQAGIPWVLVLGPDDIEAGMVSLKHLPTGAQESLPLVQAIEKIRT
jgi:histidyl-tRNA synthetase